MISSFRLGLAVALATAPYYAAHTQNTSDGEWKEQHRDGRGTHYSPLAQINGSNVSRLREVWRWSPDTSETPAEVRNISTPLMVDGMLYFTSGADRQVIAADAVTGEVKWHWRYDDGPRTRRSPRRNSGRGVSWWQRGTDQRIFVVTPGFRLVALNAKTGKPVPTFGTGGVVDLKMQLGVTLNPDSAAIGSSSPPIVWENTLVIGPALEVGLTPRSMRNVPGRVLAIDAVTGTFKWRFNTIPEAGEFGADTWDAAARAFTGNAGAWAPLSIDEKRGWVFLPVEAATGDYYGGHRPGNNLFSTSLVAVDLRTGKRVWHYQIVRHDIFDYDNPSTPIVADVTINGRPREIVVQLTKQSFAYVLDRATGEPIWPIEDRTVPASDVPGEQASPTQPMPTRPAAYDRQGVTIDDLIDFTPALRAKAVEFVKQYRMGPLFTPGSLINAADSTRGTLSLPGTLGGSNWEHGAFDPATGVLYVGSFTNPAVLAMDHVPARSDMNYIMVGGDPLLIDGLPLIKPPYSRITAIDLKTGDHAWMRVNGDTPSRVKNHQALAGLTIPPTGSQTRPVLLATGSLLFSGEGSGGAPVLRAHNKATGDVVWEMTLPGAVTAQPMTYMINGVQYLAVWSGNPRTKPATTLHILALGAI